MEVEEAVDDPAEGQRDLLPVDQECRLVCSTTELQHRCLKVLMLLDTTMSLNAHLSVHHHTH